MYNQQPSSASSSSSAIPSLFQLPPPSTPPSLLANQPPRPLLGAWPPGNFSGGNNGQQQHPANTRHQRPAHHQQQQQQSINGQIQSLMQQPPPPHQNSNNSGNRAVPLLNLSLSGPPPSQSQAQFQQYAAASMQQQQQSQPPQSLLSMNNFSMVANKAMPLMHIQPTPTSMQHQTPPPPPPPAPSLSSSSAPSIVPPPPLSKSRSSPSSQACKSADQSSLTNHLEVVIKSKLARYDKIDTNSLIDSFLKAPSAAEPSSENYESTCFDERSYQLDEEEEEELDEMSGSDRAAESKPLRFQVQTTDYNHGLSASSSSSSSSGAPSTLRADDSGPSRSNSKQNSSTASNSNVNASGAQAQRNKQPSAYQSSPSPQKQSQPAKPPSLLSLKVTSSLTTTKTSNDLPTTNLFPILPSNGGGGQRSGYSSLNSGAHQQIALQDIIQRPGRDQRASKIAIIFRGLPGSGKSHWTNLIKTEEEKYVRASEKPKILSIDNYFISEQEQRSGNKTQILMKYEFDKSMDDVYQRSLVKAFKKTLDDGLFNFVIVDMVNNRMSLLDEINLHATLRGYKLYVIELTSEDVHTCHRRNTHNRSLSEIQQLADNWDKLPAHYVKIDLKGFAPSAAGETEATDMSLDSDSENGMEPLKAPLRTPQGGGGGLPPKSKWETSSKDDEQAAESKKSDRESGCKREPLTLEEYLDDSDLLKTNSPTKSKKIRWQDDDAAAPMEKDMGFYIGQSPRSRTNLIASNPNVIKSSPSNVPFDKYKY